MELTWMREFSTPNFFAFAQRLNGVEWAAFHAKGQRTGPLGADDITAIRQNLAQCREVATFFWLPVTEQKIQRVEAALEQSCTDDTVQSLTKILNETITDELQGRLVFFMPAGRAVRYYAGANLLGEAVAARFPSLTTDIGEAGKCLSMTRNTAAVFHLMRVMEAGVREFANALGIKFTKPRTWQPMLTEAHAAINKLPGIDPRKPKFQAVVTHLHSVREAWRNPVMHPAPTYADDDAERVLSATKAFMEELAKII